MSIIYDALKKVEKNNVSSSPSDSAKEQTPKKNFVPLFVLSSLVIILGVFVANQFFNFISKDQGGAGIPGNAVKILSKAQVPAPAQVQAPAAPLDLPIKTAPASEVAPPKPKEEIKITQPPELTIEGIMYSPESSFALINKRIVKVGDKVSGATVVRITKSEVELKIDDLSFKLSTNIK